MLVKLISRKRGTAMPSLAKRKVLSFDRLIPTALLCVFSAQPGTLVSAQDQVVGFRWEEISSQEKAEFRRVVLGNQGPIQIQVKLSGKDLIKLDVDLKPRLKSNLVKNLFRLFAESDFFEEKVFAGRQEPGGKNKTTLRVDYGDSTTTFRTRTVTLASTKDPNLQTINVFFQNLCEQELTLLELKTVSRHDRSEIPKKLEALDQNLKSGRVPAPDRLIPVLENIAQDQAVMNDARNLARRIAQGVHSLMTVVGEHQKEELNRAAQSQEQASASSKQAAVPSSEDGTIRVFVELVELDVIVTNRKGRHVTDLRKEDFQILQDGKPQKIQALSYVWVQPVMFDHQAVAKASKVPPDRPGGPASTLNLGQQRRAIAVVVDELGLDFGSMGRSKKSLKKFINQQIQPTDLVALVRTGVETDEIYFTSDKVQLLKALERVKYNPRSRPGLYRLPSVTPANARSRKARARNLTLNTLATLWNTVSVMKRLPFRRSLVLVSDGFRIVHGNEATEFEIDSRIQKATRRLTDACHRASVVIYSIDARGLETPPQFKAETSTEDFNPSGSAGFYQSDGLYFLARETGGVYFKNHNDPSHATRRMLRDQQGYYRIAYTPDQSAPQASDRRFDKIKVKVKQRVLRVRARSAAYGK